MSPSVANNVNHLRSKNGALVEEPLGPKRLGRELRRGVRIYTMAELEAEDFPTPRCVASLGAVTIAEKERVVVHGSGSAGKTMLALRMALLAAVAGQTVLIFEAESTPRALRQRFRRLAAGLGVEDLASLPITVVHGSFVLRSEPEWRKLVDVLKPSIVIVDPMINFFDGDENSSRDVRNFLDCTDVAIDAGAAVVILHHATKPDQEGKTSARGSGTLRDWADTMLACSKDATGNFLVKRDKGRDADTTQPPEAITWTFTDDAILMTSKTADPNAIANAATNKRAQRVLGLLLQAPEGLTRSEIRSALSISGNALEDMLAPLFREHRIGTSYVTRTNKNGHSRKVEVIQIRVVQAPSPAAGQGDLSTYAERVDDAGGNAA